MNRIEAIEITGGLSRPSKMPCAGYSLPASACRTGSKLRKVAGSVCSKCYACKGFYLFKTAREALAKRLRLIRGKRWAEGMAYLIADEGNEFFRWHDSGDVQGRWHLEKIAEVARRLPKVLFWLPTKESWIIPEVPKLPKNLIVRYSAPMIDGRPAGKGLTSNSVMDEKKSVGFLCPAPKQAGKCGACRACWDRNVRNVSYLMH